MEKLIVLLIKACILVGELIIGLITLPLKLLFKMALLCRTWLSWLFESLFKFIFNGIWILFKRKQGIKKQFFSLSHYLFFYRVKYFIFGFLIALTVFLGNAAYLFIEALPSPSQVESYQGSLSTHLYSRDNKLLYEIYHEQNRTPIAL